MKKPSPSLAFIPDPAQGWSREIVTLDKAIVAPDPLRSRTKIAGVLYEGEDYPKASLYRGSMRFFRPAKPPAAEPVVQLPGKHLWGGFLFNHFGHFICESVSRLWAANAADYESILFVTRDPSTKKPAGYQLKLIELLGIDRPIQLIAEPTEVEELIIPGQGFGLGQIAHGTPEFHAMMAKLEKCIEPAGAERIYVSRTGVGGRGGVLLENVSERNMEAAGYTIYRPERHPLEEQLAQYKAATHIVGLDGSAFHLAGYVARPSQRYCIIMRRNMTAYLNIVRQLEGFWGIKADVVNALKGDWMPPHKRKPGRLSVGDLEHDLLGHKLKELGYIDSDAEWVAPTEGEYASALGRMQKRIGASAVMRPAVPLEVPAQA